MNINTFFSCELSFYVFSKKNPKNKFLNLSMIEYVMCRVFGTWPMAFLSVNRQRVRIEGPVCDSSEVIGWHLKSLNNSADDATRSPVHISTVGFNSSILWDPERWGRLSSEQHTSQVNYQIPLI